MIVLDTNVISETLKLAPAPQVLHWLQTRATDVTVTAITVAELSAGLEILPEGRRKSNLRNHLNALFETYRPISHDFDMACGQTYGRIIAARRVIGHPISTEDGMIAAICLSQNLPLATRNVRDFDDLGLTLINPWTLAVDSTSDE
jgi:predicted nucleic acid-binding protein